MFNYLLYRAGQFLALHLPLGASYRLAGLIADMRYVFAFHNRRNIDENLVIIFPGKNKKERSRICRALYRNFLRYLVDFLRFGLIDEKYIKTYIKVEGCDNLDAARKSGKGVIVLTGHLGNWELGGIVISALGYPFWVVAREHDDQRVNQFFINQRQLKGTKVIPLKKAARQCFAVLKENGLLGTVGDIDFGGGKMIVTEFFGKKTYFPEGPAALALKTGAPVVPGFMVRNPDDSFTLKIEKPIVPVYSEDAEKDLLMLVSRYRIILEDYIRKYPEQWYMFRKFAI